MDSRKWRVVQESYNNNVGQETAGKSGGGGKWAATYAFCVTFDLTHPGGPQNYWAAAQACDIYAPHRWTQENEKKRNAKCVTKGHYLLLRSISGIYLFNFKKRNTHWRVCSIKPIGQASSHFAFSSQKIVFFFLSLSREKTQLFKNIPG